MSIDPKQFAENLRKSTLDVDTQKALLELMPKLSMEKLEEIDAILKKDVLVQEDIIKQATLKADIVNKDFQKGLKLIADKIKSKRKSK